MAKATKTPANPSPAPANVAPPVAATTPATRLVPVAARHSGLMRALAGIFGFLVLVAVLVGIFYGARAIGSNSQNETVTDLQKQVAATEATKQAAEKDAKQAAEDAKKALPPPQGIKAGNSNETTVSAIASVEGTTDAVKQGANVSTFIKQNSKIEDECPAKKVSTSVYQSIEIRGGNDAVTYEQGEADKRRAEGQALVVAAKAKMEEVKAKYGLVKREPLPPITVKVEGHVDIGGNVGMSGEIHHTGEIVHSGFVRHDGTVIHSGEIKIVGTIDGKVTGTVTLDGKTKKVCWDGCRWIEVQ